MREKISVNLHEKRKRKKGKRNEKVFNRKKNGEKKEYQEKQKGKEIIVEKKNGNKKNNEQNGL